MAKSSNCSASTPTDPSRTRPSPDPLGRVPLEGTELTSAGPPVALYAGHVTAATTTTTAKLAALCDALRGQVLADIRVHDARAELVPGATGETIVRLTLLLDDPAPDNDTWPLDALRKMETRAWDEAARLDIPEWVYVKHTPLSDAGAFRPVRRHRTSR